MLHTAKFVIAFLSLLCLRSSGLVKFYVVSSSVHKAAAKSEVERASQIFPAHVRVVSNNNNKPKSNCDSILHRLNNNKFRGRQQCCFHSLHLAVAHRHSRRSRKGNTRVSVLHNKKRTFSFICILSQYPVRLFVRADALISNAKFRHHVSAHMYMDIVLHAQYRLIVNQRFVSLPHTHIQKIVVEADSKRGDDGQTATFGDHNNSSRSTATTVAECHVTANSSKMSQQRSAPPTSSSALLSTSRRCTASAPEFDEEETEQQQTLQLKNHLSSFEKSHEKAERTKRSVLANKQQQQIVAEGKEAKQVQQQRQKQRQQQESLMHNELRGVQLRHAVAAAATAACDKPQHCPPPLPPRPHQQTQRQQQQQYQPPPAVRLRYADKEQNSSGINFSNDLLLNNQHHHGRNSAAAAISRMNHNNDQHNGSRKNEMTTTNNGDCCRLRLGPASSPGKSIVLQPSSLRSDEYDYSENTCWYIVQCAVMKIVLVLAYILSSNLPYFFRGIYSV